MNLKRYIPTNNPLPPVKNNKIEARDKLLIGLLLALGVWAGSQLIAVEKMEEKILHLEEHSQGNREAIGGLIDLHLKK